MLRLNRGNYLTTTAARREFPSASIIETTYTQGQVLPRHSHEQVYMVVMIKGALRETARGRDHDLSRGHIVFNSAAESHHDLALGTSTRCLNVEFTPSFLSQLAADGLRPRNALIYAHAGPAIAAVGRLQSALHDPAGHLDAEEALTELVASAVTAESPRPDDFPWLPRTLDFLHSTFRRGILLDETAAVAGVHRTHLCRSFRTATGCTIGDYVRRLRADLAHQRLSNDDAPLASVAADCGYADQSHMTRELSRRYGRSPSRLRRLTR